MIGGPFCIFMLDVIFAVHGYLKNVNKINVIISLEREIERRKERERKELRNDSLIMLNFFSFRSSWSKE
jgi:hypothetical protein